MAAALAETAHRHDYCRPVVDDSPRLEIVDGRLTCWGMCEQGFWWGLVTYEIAYGARRNRVTHWIPAWTLKRKAD